MLLVLCALRLEKAGALSKRLAEAMRVAGSSHPPMFYGQVKLHKEGKPLRPIISVVGSCTYNVAKNVAHVITPFSKQANSYIKQRRLCEDSEKFEN